MFEHFRLVSFASALAAVAAPAAAQHGGMGGMSGAKHELGVDVAFVYSKPSGGNSVFTFGTPVDVRLGFVPSKGKLMFEPRVALLYLHTSGGSTHDFNLDLNVLYAKNHRKGMYWTAGAGIDATNLLGPSGSIFSLNGGVGTRSPYESGAWRLEAFLRYALKNTTLLVPNTVSIGVRAGLSLWH